MPALECSRYGKRAREDRREHHPGQLDPTFFEYELIFAHCHDKIFVFAAVATRWQRTSLDSSCLDDLEAFLAGAWTRRARKGCN